MRQRRADERRCAAEAREASLRAALERPRRGSGETVRALLAGDRQPPRLGELLAALVEKAPRLLSPDVASALVRVAEPPWVRPLSAWKPAGKGRDRLFRCLAEHLFARYRMPPFLWSAFLAGDEQGSLVQVALHVAAGGSLVEAVKQGLMPVPLTRRMCHEVMARGGEGSFLAVVRRVQTRAAGGGERLLRAWLASPAGRQLHDRDGEAFWQAALAWFAANPMLPASEVGPLVDYIAFRRRQDPAFSMKGRSVLALMRGMREWHGALARATDARRYVFPPSGLAPLDLDRSRRDAAGRRLAEVWHFREIRDGAALADEGRAMGHCVFSYADSIQRGECSIWTATLEDGTGHWRRLTIEVRSASRRIVQARGRFNSNAEALDLVALNAWASRNRLEISL